MVFTGDQQCARPPRRQLSSSFHISCTLLHWSTYYAITAPATQRGLKDAKNGGICNLSQSQQEDFSLLFYYNCNKIIFIDIVSIYTAALYKSEVKCTNKSDITGELYIYITIY